MTKKDKVKSMEEVTANYEKFIEGKKLNANGKRVFNKTLKKTVNKKPKQHGSK